MIQLFRLRLGRGIGVLRRFGRRIGEFLRFGVLGVLRRRVLGVFPRRGCGTFCPLLLLRSLLRLLPPLLLPFSVFAFLARADASAFALVSELPTTRPVSASTIL